jgi:hypothetical protein
VLSVGVRLFQIIHDDNTAYARCDACAERPLVVLDSADAIDIFLVAKNSRVGC